MLAIATAAKMSSTASTGNRSRDMAQVSDGRSAERAFCAQKMVLRRRKHDVP